MASFVVDVEVNREDRDGDRLPMSNTTFKIDCHPAEFKRAKDTIKRAIDKLQDELHGEFGITDVRITKH